MEVQSQVLFHSSIKYNIIKFQHIAIYNGELVYII
jgi:hypothetical protein